MMTFKFNLCEEPWIPVAELEGGCVTHVSLQELFARAHEIREIVHPSPLVVSALQRFLLAILHASSGFPSEEQWGECWKSKRWSGVPVLGYLDKHLEHFDLFDSKRPFYQVAGFESSSPSPPQRLMHEASSGENTVLFDHHFDKNPVLLKPGEAALYLIANQAWSICGGRSSDGFPNLTNATLMAGAIIMVQGDSLFSTLMLNFVGESALHGWPTANDRPSWENDTKQPVNMPSGPFGYLDYLTWQSRTIRLHPAVSNGETVVEKVSYAQGRDYDPGQVLFDPAIAYRKDEKKGWFTLKINQARACWRDSGALLNLPTLDPNVKRPEVLQWLAMMSLSTILKTSERLDIRTYALCNDPGKAKIFLWRRDSMPIPPALLNDKDRVDAVKQGIALAEEVARILDDSLFMFVRLIRERTKPLEEKIEGPAKDRINKVRNSLQSLGSYWAKLDTEFQQFLHELSQCETGSLGDFLLQWLDKKVVRSARLAFDGATKSYCFDADGLKAQTIALSHFQGRINGLKKKENEDSDEK